MEDLVTWGVPFIVWLQSLPDAVTDAMRFVSHIADVEVLVLALPLLLWCVDERLGLRVGVVLLAYGTLDTAMKNVFQLPRPYWLSDEVVALSTETSYGLPSGHSGFAAAVFGRLAAGAQRRSVRVALVLLIAVVGLSRIQLGVHWPADVLAGFAVGAALCAGIMRLEGPVAERAAAWSTGARMAATLGLALGLLALVGGFLTLRGGTPLPPAWVDAATAVQGAEPLDVQSLEGPVTSTGALFGLLGGWSVLASLGGFRAGGPWHRRLLRYPVGVVGVAVLVLGGRAVVPAFDTLAGKAALWMQFALVGGWISLGAPLVFRRLGLADRTGDPGNGAGGSH